MRPGHFLAIGLTLLAGCPSSSECERDFDCSGGQVCANTHECLSSSEVRGVEIRWTLYGQQASDATCGAIDHMELTVFNSAADQSATYSPVESSRPSLTSRARFVDTSAATTRRRNRSAGVIAIRRIALVVLQ